MPFPHKILVVDDEEKIRRSLGGLLEDNGYEVATAGSGPECLQLMAARTFDLVMLDLVMPAMDGVEVLQELKARYRDTEVIIISGYADRERAIAAFRLNTYDIVEKPFESKEILKTIANCLDHLELRKEVERAHQMTYDILEKSPYGIMVINREGTIDYVNPAMLHISGDTHEQIKTLNIYNLPNYRELGITDKIVSALSGLPFSIGPVEITSHFGKKTTVRNIIGVPLGEGEKRSALLFIEDVTGQKRMEEEKSSLEAQLRHIQKMEAIGTLTGGVAHEFNNIINVILGFGDLVRTGLDKDEHLRPYVDRIIFASERASNLTRGLLAFSRRQAIDPKPVELNELIRNLKELLSRTIGERITVSTLLASENMVVMGDGGQLEQVLMNLAINARDAMPAGGYVAISTEHAVLDEEYRKTRSYVNPGSYALISVTDTGTGMDENTVKRIFEPFFTTKEVGKGTGLGLSIVYGIIKQHNGYIHVYSEPGKGTAFKIYLPLVRSIVQETVPAEAPVPEGGKETLILAEDNDIVREFSRTLLEMSGYTVIEAVDGEDAIAKFMKYKDETSLLILDVIMPKKNGKEVYDGLKRVRPDIKAVFTSGYTADIIQKEGLLAEGFEFISKPVAPNAFLRKIREILDR